MSDLLKTTLICAALACAAPAFAQSTDATDTTQTTQPETPSAERTDGLSTGEDAIEEGQTYIVSEHGDWDLRCIKAPQGQTDPCQLYQLLEDQNDNAVAEINLFSLSEDDNLAAGATIVTPLQTLLTRDVVLSVDGGQAKTYPFTFCTQIGCFARVGFTSADVTSFKRGNTATIVVVPAQAPDQKVELTVSLSGFTAGFDAVTKIANGE